MIAADRQFDQPRFPHRWVCNCDPRHEPVQLARYNDAGQIQIKVRDRWFYIDHGQVRIVCPRCGRMHRRLTTSCNTQA